MRSEVSPEPDTRVPLPPRLCHVTLRKVPSHQAPSPWAWPSPWAQEEKREAAGRKLGRPALEPELPQPQGCWEGPGRPQPCCPWGPMGLGAPGVSGRTEAGADRRPHGQQAAWWSAFSRRGLVGEGVAAGTTGAEQGLPLTYWSTPTYRSTPHLLEHPRLPEHPLPGVYAPPHSTPSEPHSRETSHLPAAQGKRLSGKSRCSLVPGSRGKQVGVFQVGWFGGRAWN